MEKEKYFIDANKKLFNKKEIIDQTAQYIKKRLEGESSGHDWWHVYRVWKMAIYLAEKEKADGFIVELAALLHDIADWKFCDGDEIVGPKMARRWLESLSIANDVIDQICQIIKDISFKGAKVATPMKTKEGMIVQDADRLDAIGAVGIGRCFAYGGYKKNLMYDPHIKPVLPELAEKYKNNKSTSINHFYEKLLFLKDRMNTRTGCIIAEERHIFMKTFLDRFLSEWESSVLLEEKK